VKHFINERSSIVTEAIDALVLLGEGKLARLDGYPAIKVVVRTDWDRSQVAVVSGGGAGHEPAHAGFVGDGMLTAAVCGEIFASPSVDAVLAGILAVTGRAGCLLIVKNYTGDRLNFGLAAERARAMGLRVEMVIVADDIALPDAVRPRGVAGTLFVHKVAGQLARGGAPLEVVKDCAERVAASVRSLGVSLSSCSIPGVPSEARIGPDEMEIGLGIHGEPGAEKVAYRPFHEIVSRMVERLDASLDDTKNTKAPVAILVNDLGGVPPIEMAVATRSLLAAMKREVALVLGPARMMTSLDMKGLSISALPLTPEIERMLLDEVGPAAWPRGRRVVNVAPLALPAMTKKGAPPSSDPARRDLVTAACTTLIAIEAELDALDAKVGDGDTGRTFATAARALLADLDSLPFADAAALCDAIAERLATVMGGSSGVLLGIGLSAMGVALGTTPSWPQAFHEGVRRIQRYGGATEGDRTMLDALLPAARAFEETGSLEAAAEAASKGAERTASMLLARAGRASYVPSEALRGVPDPGAVAVTRVLRALADART
jgi:dihydroxyacetone kinase